MASGHSRVICCLVVTGVAAFSSSIAALNVSTHRLVNIAAADTPEFDSRVREFVGLSSGSNSELTGSDGRRRNVLEWLGQGGEREDDGLLANGRFHNHFHNPFKPWSESGLHALRHQSSSIHWMQDPAQSPGGNWTWRRARQLYLQALTAPDANAREEAAADMFRALGQIMHLVVDASVPEHTRGDAHPFGTLWREALKRRRAGNYEYWVSDQHTRANDTATAAAEAEFRARYLSSPVGFDPAVFAIPPPAGETLARVPVARLIDADKYQGESPDPNVTLGGAIGLAEFANANFFSEDTFTGQFPFPRREDLVPNPRVAPGSARVRAYLAKPAGFGLPTSVALAECVSERPIARWIVSRPSPYPCVDEAVWEETAAHLLPRAVGYARGVLQYFFRGTLKVHRLYTESGNAFIRIENLSGEDMEGVFAIHARPNAGTAAEGREQSGLVNGGAAATIAAGSTVTFPVTLMAVNDATASQILVFRGRIGLEQEAVAAQTFVVQHVLVNFTRSTAFFNPSCTTASFGFSTTCDWFPLRHEIEGEFITGSDVPVIKTVYAFWTLGTRFVNLELDGLPVPPSLIWRRQGDEPDPKRFLLRPGPNFGTRLFLSVELIDGTVIGTETSRFINARATAGKRAQIARRPFYAVADRTEFVRTSTAPPYRVLSISGYPNPTNTTQNRFGHADLTEPLLVQDRPSSFDVLYSQRWIDAAQVFPNTATSTQVVNFMHTMPWGPPPTPRMEAVIERMYQPEELEFLKMFTVSEPPTAPLTMIGIDVSGT